MDRRSFLKQSGMAALAGAAVPMVFSCSAGGRGSACNGLTVKSSYKTKVLVVGGGPAGVCAAIAAARLGVDTMLVEQGGCLGGMATRGLVAPFMTSFDASGEVQVIRGLFDEIVCRMVGLGGKASATVPDVQGKTLRNAVELFARAGIVPVLKGEAVKGAVVLTRKGLEQIDAEMVIDATGDGDVAAAAGVPSEFGNPELGKVQPSTLFFRINCVDSKRLEADVMAHIHEFRKVDGVSYRALHWWVEKAEEAGEWDIARKSVNIYRGVREDEWAVNCTRIANVDATDSESLTAGEAEGRRQVRELMDFFHKYVPGCEKAALMSSASTLGIRESRHIAGEYRLTAEDLLTCQVPEDSILLASNSVDVHGRTGAMGTEYKTISGGNWYGVPYRSILPQGVDNLLIPGRCLSATSDAAGAVRVMPPCMAMGEAAGVAAALAAKGGTTPKRLEAGDLLAQLKKQNVFLG